MYIYIYSSVLLLSGWWFQSLRKISVSWDYYSQYMEKWKLFQTTNQLLYLSIYLIYTCIFDIWHDINRNQTLPLPISIHIRHPSSQRLHAWTGLTCGWASCCPQTRPKMGPLIEIGKPWGKSWMHNQHGDFLGVFWKGGTPKPSEIHWVFESSFSQLELDWGIYMVYPWYIPFSDTPLRRSAFFGSSCSSPESVTWGDSIGNPFAVCIMFGDWWTLRCGSGLKWILCSVLSHGKTRLWVKSLVLLAAHTKK
jgi:hypothetical protein